MTHHHQRAQEARLREILPRFFGDLAEDSVKDVEGRLEWVTSPGGSVLFDRGDAGDSLYIVVSGRLQAWVENEDGGRRVLGEVAAGEAVGEMALITGHPRIATVGAVRDSTLVRLSAPDFEELSLRHPTLLRHLARLVISRNDQPPSSTKEVTTIAVAGPDQSRPEFVARLLEALRGHGTAMHLSADTVGPASGVTIEAEAHDLHPGLTEWLAEQEGKHRFLVYECDAQPTSWSRRCLRQADVILLVAEASAAGSPLAVETELLDRTGVAPYTRRALVALHRPGRRPAGAGAWMNGRRIDELHRVEGDEGYRRMARLMAGTAVGLVLGGGGARGFVHVGTVKALREAGVPIDLVGGTSMGSVVAAQVAMGWDVSTMVEESRRVFVDEKPLSDYTLPVVSILKGRRIERSLQRHFGELDIEDLLLNFFCIASNMTDGSTMVMRSGPLWKALRASVSLPGVLPPVVHGNDLLIDGGMVNNLPVDVMRASSAGRVIAVDPIGRRTYELNYEEVPSAWKLLRQRILPGKTRIRVPSLTNIMMKATILGSTHRIPEHEQAAELYLNPPLRGVGMMDMADFDRIVDVGYRYAAERIEDWLADQDEIRQPVT